MKKTKRYDAIDGLRTFACIMVVLLHVYLNGKYNISNVFFSKFLAIIHHIVPLFMTISGFGMCCGYYTKAVDGRIDYVDFYKKRYQKILPFFAALSIIDVMASPSKAALCELFANLTLCFGLIPNADISVIGVGWFLGTIFVFYLMFPFYVFLLSDKKRAWISFIVSIIMHYLCVYYFGASINSIANSFVYFMAGGMIYIYLDRLENNIAKSASIVLSILAIVLFYVNDIGVILFVVLYSTILIYAINTSKKGLLDNKATKCIGGLSFEIYLCHMLVYRVLEKLHFTKLTGVDWIDYIIAFTIVFIGSAIVAFSGKAFIDKGFKLIEVRKRGLEYNV